MSRVIATSASFEQSPAASNDGFDESSAAEYDAWLAMVDAQFADEEADAAFVELMEEQEADFDAYIADAFRKLKAL